MLVPGRHLTGDEVSDNPALVEAKLKGRLAPASKERLEPLRVAYAAAGLAVLSGSETPPPGGMCVVSARSCHALERCGGESSPFTAKILAVE